MGSGTHVMRWAHTRDTTGNFQVLPATSKSALNSFPRNDTTSFDLSIANMNIYRGGGGLRYVFTAWFVPILAVSYRQERVTQHHHLRMWIQTCRPKAVT